MSNDAKCTIRANPDISGLGVRISIYGQAILTLLVLGIVFADGKVTKKERDVLIEAHRNLLVTACALLAASYIQIIIGQLSPYHALLVLNLSWINTAMGFAFTYFEDEIAPPPEVAGIQGILPPSHPFVALGTFLQHNPRKFQSGTFSTSSGGNFSALLHLGMMGILGIYTWQVIPRQSPIWEDECRSLVRLVLGGHSHSLLSPDLRKGSLAMYSLGVILGFAGILGMLLLKFKPVSKQLHRLLSPILLSPVSRSPELQRMLGIFESAHLRLPVQTIRPPASPGSAAPVLAALDTIVARSVLASLILIAIGNSQFLSTQEREWSFGQTLAIILLITPVWTACRGAYVWWKETRSKPDEKKLGLENEVKRDEKHDDILVDAGYYISHV